MPAALWVLTNTIILRLNSKLAWLKKTHTVSRLEGARSLIMVPSIKIAIAWILLSNIAYAYKINVDFHDGKIKTFDIPSGNLSAEEFLQSPHKVVFEHSASPDERRDCQTDYSYHYEIDGDGDPHQNYKIAQVENTLVSCPASVTIGEAHTFSWSISASANPGNEEWDFLALGFAVTESDTKSVSYGFQCVGSETEICAFHYTAVTALSVNLYKVGETCGSDRAVQIGIGTVFLPNANGIGSTVSRGVNFGPRNIIQCRGQAVRELDFNCGPKGGPEWFDTEEIGPWSDAYLSALDPPGCAVPIEALKFKD